MSLSKQPLSSKNNQGSIKDKSKDIITMKRQIKTLTLKSVTGNPSESKVKPSESKLKPSESKLKPSAAKVTSSASINQKAKSSESINSKSNISKLVVNLENEILICKIKLLQIDYLKEKKVCVLLIICMCALPLVCAFDDRLVCAVWIGAFDNTYVVCIGMTLINSAHDFDQYCFQSMIFF